MKAVSKTMYSTRAFLVLAGLTLTLGGGAAAQRNASGEDWCRDQSRGDSDRRSSCEVREYTVPAAGATMTIDASPNGGISVDGASRGDILVPRPRRRHRRDRGGSPSHRGAGADCRDGRPRHRRRPAQPRTQRELARQLPTRRPDPDAVVAAHHERRHRHRQREQPRRVQDRQRRGQAVAHGRGRRRAHDQRRHQRGPRRRHVAGQRARRADLERGRAPRPSRRSTPRTSKPAP